jgi:hypothetical protein
VVPLSVLFFFDLMLTLRFGTRDWIPNLDNLEILGGVLRAKDSRRASRRRCICGSCTTCCISTC